MYTHSGWACKEQQWWNDKIYRVARMNDANVLQSMSFFAGHGSKVNKVMKSYSQDILDNPITIDNVINKCTEE